jgi:hypothetical protein
MAMRKRTRDRQAALVQPMLPAGSTLRGYAVGRGHARLTNTAIVVSGAFVALFLVFVVVFHVILIPGGLLLIIVINEVRPMRGVALTEQGLALVRRSMWTGRPRDVVALLGPVPLTGRTISFGDERVTLSSGEMGELQRAASFSGPPPPATSPPPAGYPGPASGFGGTTTSGPPGWASPPPSQPPFG